MTTSIYLQHYILQYLVNCQRIPHPQYAKIEFAVIGESGVFLMCKLLILYTSLLSKEAASLCILSLQSILSSRGASIESFRRCPFGYTHDGDSGTQQHRHIRAQPKAGKSGLIEHKDILAVYCRYKITCLIPML